MAHIGKSYFALEPSEADLQKLPYKERSQKITERRRRLKSFTRGARFKTKAQAERVLPEFEDACGFKLRIAEMADIFI